MPSDILASVRPFHLLLVTSHIECTACSLVELWQSASFYSTYGIFLSSPWPLLQSIQGFVLFPYSLRTLFVHFIYKLLISCQVRFFSTVIAAFEFVKGIIPIYYYVRLYRSFLNYSRLFLGAKTILERILYLDLSICTKVLHVISKNLSNPIFYHCRNQLSIVDILLSY